jgi:hypothetical protein
VTLKGIACQRYSVHLRKTILAKLANEWRLERLDDLHDEISLAELGESVERMLQGRLPYRAVINLDR